MEETEERINQGLRVEKLINYLGISQKELAIKLEFSQPFITQIIKGQQPLTRKFVERLSKAYDINKSWLIDGDGQMFRLSVSTSSFQTMEYIPKNIAIIRRRWGLSQAELGALIGATRSQISNWERGRTMPAVDELHRLASLAGVNADRLHTSVLSSDSISLSPGSIVKPVVQDDDILLILNKINDNLIEIKALLGKVIS